MDNTETNVSVNYSNLQDAASTISTNAVLGGLVAGVMSLHPNDDILQQDQESREDFDDSMAVSETTSSVGHFLFDSFIKDQIIKEGLQDPDDEVITKPKPVKEEAQSLGRDLRRLADAFESSYERREVKKKASSCTIDSYSEFSQIAGSLFNQGGITHSRIVVLFFFCSDLAIRTLKECAKNFQRFVSWFFKFLADYVYHWVERNGGWCAVLNNKSYKKYIFSTVIVCLVAVGIYKWVNKK